MAAETPGFGGLRVEAPADGADALGASNVASRAAYRSAKEEGLSHVGPVELREGDDLVLRIAGQRTVVSITPETYTALKAICHVPLAVHGLVGSSRVDLQACKLEYSIVSPK